MSKICELFGLSCSDLSNNFDEVIKTQFCPYIKRECIKSRKSEPNIKIGTCSVKYQNQNIIICPHRLLENNQIFIDCKHLITKYEVENELYLIPEVKVPGGYVDYFLVSVKDGKIIDFVGIELQTLDTTGSIWPERQCFLTENGIENGNYISKKPFSMNWKMTVKTILVQILQKSKYFESLNKHLVLIIQKPLYEYMNNHFNFDEINNVNSKDSIHIHAYDFKEEENKYSLLQYLCISTTSVGIANCLGLNKNSVLEENELIKNLEQKLTKYNKIENT